jgi:hypothetical protein
MNPQGWKLKFKAIYKKRGAVAEFPPLVDQGEVWDAALLATWIEKSEH